MACDNGAVPVSVEPSGETAQAASDQAARAGVGLAEYVRKLGIIPARAGSRLRIRS